MKINFVNKFLVIFVFSESTHSVDGSSLWLLKLDQDLVNTLRVSFPEWNFGTSTVVTAAGVEDIKNNNSSSTNAAIIVENQRKNSSKYQSHRKTSSVTTVTNNSKNKHYSKSSSISSTKEKMAEGESIFLISFFFWYLKLYMIFIQIYFLSTVFFLSHKFNCHF